jgi:hypothetical protein
MVRWLLKTPAVGELGSKGQNYIAVGHKEQTVV